MRERVPIPRPARGLLIAAATLALAFACAGCGSSSPHGGDSLARANFTGFNLAFRYPSAWRRQDWCWLGNDLFPLTLLTTASIAPRCHPGTSYSRGTLLPPPQRLDPNGVTAWWLAANRAGSARFTPNATVDGRPARITVQQEPTRRTFHSYVNCTGSGTKQRLLQALIRGPSPTVDEVQLGAVICGPDFAAGEAQVRKMLASLRFTG